MKKIMKVTQGKRFLSLVLAVVMMATVFNMALPMLKLDASAAEKKITTSSGETVTQTRVVSDYEATYENYAAQYLNSASTPTDIVIPGLDPAQDYVIQGMTYYPERDWMLVTAYHNADTDNGETVQSSKVFALEASTGDFVAMFSFINVNGTVNTDHGGGIAVSEHNIYYACGDQDRKIAYAPLDALAKAKEGEHVQIQLVAEKDFVEVGSVSSGKKTAYTAYVCFDEGILWTGNFYDPGADLLGIDIAATDYNAPANNTYHSMVFGYKLQGSTSEEEWANLVGAKGTDCQGNPSYSIGLGNAIKDVQYAVVDNGKLFLSRSFGSGAGNSVRFGFGETSFLTVADIDLSQPGTQPVEISTTSTGSLDKTVMAHNISDFKDYAMMPMSEGLCFIDDQLFITFEGASNKYLNESDGWTSIGNCEKPIDVIWQLDPYELMETTVSEPEKSIYYEKVTSLSEIGSGGEYIIVHESQREDPITQKNYLYALDADGNFNGHKLSKSTVDTINGYNGMIGHPISYYSFDTTEGKEILYLDNPDVDDIESIRWKITKAADGSYRFENTETYFANCNYLFFNDQKITMAPGNAGYLSEFRIQEAKTDKGVELGGFWLSNNDTYFLWCNDGTSDFYNDKFNSYYKSNEAMYPDVTEVPGTMHCDALNLGEKSNVIDGTILTGTDTGYEDGVFYIYKREVDSEASTYESRVYTNLDSKLEADGTYTVTLDTYAISPNHYQYVGERPTDYIIVADTSYSMIEGGSTGVREFTETDILKVNSLCNKSDTSGDRGEGIIGYTFYNSQFDIRYLYNGKYYKMYMAINNTNVETFLGGVTDINQYYFLYFIGDDGKYYCFSNQSPTPNYICTQAKFKEWVANPDNEAGGYKLQTASSKKTDNEDRRGEKLFEGKHARFDNINSEYAKEHKNIDSLKTTANNLVDAIKKQNPENRIAVVKYGNTTSYWGSSGWTSSGFTNAFWDVSKDSDVNNIKTQINNISVSTTDASSTQASNDGLELYGAEQIIANSGINYKEGGKRNLAVIFLSDGIPGDENAKYNTDCDKITGVKSIAFDKTDSAEAANKVIAKAQTMKDSGAFIYTVLFGDHNVENFSKKTYMDAVSSKYPAATAMDADKLGGQSVDGVTYAMNIATASYDYFTKFGSIACEGVASNNAVALDNLDDDSYIRAVLGEALYLPDNEKDYDIKAQLVSGTYDAIGRFKFGKAENTNAIVPKIDEETKKIITVTGYDYSTQYISKGNPGQALRIIITGLLANGTIDNELVSDIDKTAIYKTKKHMDDSINETTNFSFKKFPIDRENISEYTYVLDYGLQMLDEDVNGTMLALDNGPNAQPRNADGISINYSRAIDSGMVEITNNSKDLLYKLEPTATSASGYVLVERDEDGRAGTYDWFKINVVPASNVYFEEDDMVVKKADETNNNKKAWTTEGTPIKTLRSLPDEDDVDGFDNAYVTENSTFSNGTAYTVTVDSANRNSKNYTFDFTGTGIDIVSRCNNTTGVMLISVKKEVDNGKGGTKLVSVKTAIVDTYCAEGDFKQTPIFSWSGDHGTYTVEIGAMYLTTAKALNATNTTNSTTKGIKNNLIDTGLEMTTSETFDASVLQTMLDDAGVEDVSAEDVELIWFDDNSIFNGGTGVAPTKKGSRADGTPVTQLVNYIDGFRIYNPIDPDPDEGDVDYSDYKDTEKYASYVNVSKNLSALSTDDGTFGEIAFITGVTGNFNFETYQQKGPKDELYLNNDKGISFKVDISAGEKVMLGLRAVNGPVSISVNDDGTGDPNDENRPWTATITSATEMYYDISNCIDKVGDDVTITITNNGNGENDKGLLAVNHIKFSGGTAFNGTVDNTGARSLTRSNGATTVASSGFLPITQEDLTIIESSMSGEPILAEVRNGVIVPIVEDEEEIPGDNTTPDVPSDDTNNDDTNTDNSETGDFSIFSLLELLISIIEKILHNSFGTGNLF